MPHMTLLIMFEMTTLPLSIDIGSTGRAFVVNSTQTKMMRTTTLTAKLETTLMSDHKY